MESWDISQNSQINVQSPYQSLEPLTWNNSMAISSESLLINEPFSDYSEFSDKEQWTQFLADENEDEYCAAKEDNREEKKEAVQVHSPMAASSHSGFDEQQSEVLCAEDELPELSDDSGSRKSSEGEIVDSKSKKRKRSGERGPKYAFKTRSETDVLEDGFKWRKYGKKTIKSSPHPRSYYRCSDSNCGVKKRVERDPTDHGVLITTYEGKHNHESPSVIYYVGKPIILQHPGSKPAIVLVNAGLYS
ncbi:hypothetical protein SUGI_0149550 [Cryptomeria japonica]|uniref:WRKY transcription factor 71 n=1 Tax=Cryptomeria japonica TaxID=3369 RepID=UPI002408A982|nr:WRKY transcription factor 71 [Cryptomeria japonica]GLJ11263.1 hypothetical protein SUGI_0149550 [Cryptomeria japonica]